MCLGCKTYINNETGNYSDLIRDENTDEGYTDKVYGG